MVKREKLKESDMQRTSHEVQNCTISFCRNSENPQQISLLFISFVKNFEDEQENKSNSEEIMVKKSVSIYWRWKLFITLSHELSFISLQVQF